MDHSYWHQQTSEKPLFPELEWSRPQNRRTAGKLLIVGGSSHGFNSVAQSYSQSLSSGIGTARVILPDSLKRTVEKIFEGGEFAASTTSGNFSSQSLSTLLDSCDWADGVLLAGDFGNNSQTAIVLEKFVDKYSGPLVVAGDGLEYFFMQPKLILEREQTTLVLRFNQFQKLIAASKFPEALTSKMDLFHTVELLHNFSLKFSAANFTLINEGLVYVASNGEVSSTRILPEKSSRKDYAAAAAVWWVQSPNKSFAALTTSVL